MLLCVDQYCFSFWNLMFSVIESCNDTFLGDSDGNIGI